MADENEETGAGTGGEEPSENEKRLMAELAERNKDLEAERLRANAAERARLEAEKRASEAGTSIQDSQINQLEATMAAMDTKLASLEDEIERASAEGNHRQVAALSRQLARTEAEKLTLENGKAALEAAKAAGPMRPPQGRTTGDPATDPAENIAQQIQSQGYHRSARWIRANPQFARDPNLWEKLQIVHRTFIAKYGPDKADTDDYFNFVEGHEFIAPDLTSPRSAQSGTARAAQTDRQGDEGGDDARSTAAAGRARVNGNGNGNGVDAVDRRPPAAPPSRAGAGSRGARLTPDEREQARNSGLTDEEYAANKEALLAEGRIGPKARTH